MDNQNLWKDMDRILKNKDRKFLRNGGRKAPAMSVEQFQQLVLSACPPKLLDHYRTHIGETPESCREAIGDVLGEALSCAFENDFEVDVESTPEVGCFVKAVKDWKVYSTLDNLIVKSFKMRKDGVPYMWFAAGGDSEIPVFAMLYWDGKTFRTYIPTYGNTYNVKCKAAYNEDDIAALCDAFEARGEIFLRVLEADEAACEEDFYCRVTCVGAVSSEEFLKWKEKLCKNAAKYEASL